MTMAIFTPGRRWQPAYLPFGKLSIPHRALASIERLLKGIFFGCRMCGNCLLQETAFICPMECPKGLRNGPCGGSTPEHCYVDKTRLCVWYKIYERAEKLGRTKQLLEVLPPLDWDKVGTDTWADGFRQLHKTGWGTIIKGLINPQTRSETWDQFFREIRQPAWWQGDAQPHPAPNHEAYSKLEEKLRAGKFVVTAEIAPPLAAVPDDIVRKIDMLRDYIDAANFTDNPSATPRMSSLACCSIAIQNGIEPVMQIAARDRTRMGLQGEVIGAAALGIRNILCITGDHPREGPKPSGRMDIWDLDAIQMIWIIRRMRDEGRFLDGREIKVRPPVFIGAAGSPFASNDRFQAIREEKKVNAGAQFFQTQLVYDVEGFERYLAALDQRGVLGRVFMLPGITPIRSLRAAQAIGSVPGVKMPPWIVERMEKSADPQEEGIQITLEIIEQVKRLHGVNGIHIMAIGWESIVPRLVTESGLREQDTAP
ncbi:MAG: methylenetetrahydrofolate reductase C-terminal domain-containing protein [Deltaproteobacteria bacterium]|nr:methylenetetrahydrofolate reductase C-terminal domain-containing protein [Deltaproteobacteria bacterium]